MLSSQKNQSRSWSLGEMASSPVRTACTASAAMSRQFSHHCGIMRGSTKSPEREQTGSAMACGASPRHVPLPRQKATTASRAS
jgi:hypothetical protein